MKIAKTIVMMTVAMLALGSIGYAAMGVDTMGAERLLDGPVRNIDTGESYDNIQDAIDAVETEDGHTIEVDSGVYRENVVVHKQLTIRGESSEDTIIDAMGGNYTVILTENNSEISGFMVINATGEPGVGLLVANLIEEGMREDGPPPTMPSENALVEDIVARYNNMGIALLDNSGSVLRNSVSYDNSRMGIVLHDAHNCNVYNNTAHDNVEHGIMVMGSSGNTVTENHLISNVYGILLAGSEGNTVTYNTATDHVLDIENEGGIGIAVFNSTSNNVYGNYALRNINVGIAVYLGYDNFVYDNTVHNNTDGISLYGTEENTIISNDIYGSDDRGIMLHDAHENTIIRNTIQYDDGTGIFLYESNYNSVDQNIISDSFQGLFVSDSESNEIVNNDVKGCVVGIFLGGNNVHNLIRDNIIENNVYGIYLSESDENTISENMISKNTGGILLRESDLNTIYRNTIHKQTGIGIEIFDEANGNLIKYNIISENDDGITIQNSVNNTIYRNVFEDNNVSAKDDIGGILLGGEPGNNWDGEDPAEGGLGGNYWDDYEGIDRGDGIGEPEYNITGDAEAQDRYPWISTDMVHPVGSFVVTVEDITAGEAPLIMISDLEDVHGNQLQGEYATNIDIDGDIIDIVLLYEEGHAEYVDWDNMTVSGTYTIEITIEEVTETSTFVISPHDDVDTVIISSEDDVEDVVAGTDLNLTAEARDIYGNIITDDVTEFVWCDNATAPGIFNQEIAGDYDIMASYNGVESNTITITVEAGDLYSIEISPDESTVDTGDSQTYTAVAYDEYGNEIGYVTADTIWSIEDGAGGNWTANVYTSENIGTWTVTGTYENKTDTAELTVEDVHIPLNYTLTIEAEVGGDTNPSPDTYTYVEGTIVTIEAIPDSGWRFTGWAGNASGTDLVINVTMNRNRTVTAQFEEDVETYELDVNIEGQGTVNISPESTVYQEGAVVTLTANPASGWSFSHWSGDASGSEREITVTMDEDKTITAHFIEDDDDEEPSDFLSDNWWLLLILVLVVIIILVLVMKRGKGGVEDDDMSSFDVDDDAYVEDDIYEDEDDYTGEDVDEIYDEEF